MAITALRTRRSRRPCYATVRAGKSIRFRELMGETPLDHLTQWRMIRAAGMMREDRSLKLAAIAEAVGYESEGAFGKTFRSVMGMSPGKYRQQDPADVAAA